MNPSFPRSRIDPAASPDRQGWVLALILLLAMVLRLWGSDYSLWYDEIASTRFAAQPWHRLWSDWMISETNPPLYYSLLKLWIGLVGDSDARIRLLSTLIGLAGIACAWQLARQLAGQRAAAIAALLIAVSQQHVFYSQMVRGYGMGHGATLLALVGLTGLARAWDRQDALGRRARSLALATYAAGAGLAVYSHTTLVLVPLLANVWAAARFARQAWLERRLPPGLGGWSAANLAVLLAWSWWARITWLQSTGMGSNIGWIQRPSAPYAVRMTLESYIPWGLGAERGPLVLLIAALFGGLFGWGLWRARTTARARGLDAVAAFALGAPVLLFAISLARPIFLPRTVYFAAGPFLVVVAIGLASLPRRLFGIGLALVLLLQGAAYAAWFRHREIEPWRAVAAAVSAPGAPRAVAVKGVGPAWALQRYCAQPNCGKQVLVLRSPLVDHWSDGMDRPAPAQQADLARALACGRPLATLRWSADDPAADLPVGAKRVGGTPTWGAGGSIGLAQWTLPGTSRAGCPAR